MVVFPFFQRAFTERGHVLVSAQYVVFYELKVSISKQ